MTCPSDVVDDPAEEVIDLELGEDDVWAMPSAAVRR